MDVFLVIETVEIVGIILYVGYARQTHDDRLTQACLLLNAALLAVDVFILRRHRPAWFRDGLNLYALLSWGYFHAKVLHKYVGVVISMLGF
jgi:hypothetical protein